MGFQKPRGCPVVYLDMGLGMTKIVIDAHKCLKMAEWAGPIKDQVNLGPIADQISVLAGVKVLAVAWENPSNSEAQTWCRLWARFPTQESAMEFILKWQ